MTAKISELCEKIKEFLTENGLKEIPLICSDYDGELDFEDEEYDILYSFDSQRDLYMINSMDYVDRFLRTIYLEDNELFFDIEAVVFDDDANGTSVNFREKLKIEEVVELSKDNQSAESVLGNIMSYTLSGSRLQLLLNYYR